MIRLHFINRPEEIDLPPNSWVDRVKAHLERGLSGHMQRVIKRRKK